MFKRIINNIKDFVNEHILSRTLVLVITILAIFAIITSRLFVLQIVEGANYLENFTLTIKREITIAGTRGKIYDRNGELLAYNELSYDVTIEDNGTYSTRKEKNEAINKTISDLIDIVEKNGDKVVSDFNIGVDEGGNYKFLVDGTKLLRFLADIFGHKYTDDLKYNEDLGYDEAKASAKDVVKYLSSSAIYGISDKYDKVKTIKIITVRFALAQNAYQKYISTTVANQVSDATVAAVMEHIDELVGVNIEENTIRKYNDSVCLSSILGYTGVISDEEMEKLNKDEKKYDSTDIVGKAGIEQVMDSYLQGSKGSETLYVDNVGKVIKEADFVPSSSGNDVYLTIDKDLQAKVYKMIEEQLAGIICSKLINVKNYNVENVAKASEIKIPMDDVYFALINNNIIDINHFTANDASENEKAILSAYEVAKAAAVSNLTGIINDSSGSKPYNTYTKEIQAYCDYIQTSLNAAGVIVTSNFKDDETFDKWTKGNISLYEFLSYAISSGNLDSTQIETSVKYSDSAEVYQSLVEYITKHIFESDGFSKIVYDYMIKNDAISDSQLCLILFDQGIIQDTGSEAESLSNGSVSAYNFMYNKIKTLVITPAMLALDPCSASCVVTDVNSGEVLAMVSYPGYDNNRLANTVDANYYSALTKDKSLPLFNHATQEKTAPGSTYKMITATAGLTEGYVTTGTTFTCTGIFNAISPPAKCWKYPSAHGALNVSQAIQHSCNYYFNELGYMFGQSNGSYDSDLGLSVLKKYASMYGLNAKSGVEIPESDPEISDKDSVRSAIGQGSNNYTTVQLARYVTTVANSGTCYNLSLLDKVTDSEGNTIEDFTPAVYNTLDEVNASTWDAIHTGMHAVIGDLDAFKNTTTDAAGKTGTAEEVSTRGNHALFVSYAPYDSPQIALATRIPYGYSSGNAAEIGSEVIRYYFKEEGYENIIDGMANSSGQVVGD
ncbi:penicillin-binding transpeptidase domain-containing protein [Acetitomaculum ruminis]|uniref:penicillin-binding transpeptidase domain-containing protein n=1 Tax=Acetitomaculum ruminis TaxID=2382 RepID=UPI000AA34299|nr:penicillin-binding transpeptidase domain-containing protein [Acetitomaculum ruminis]